MFAGNQKLHKSQVWEANAILQAPTSTETKLSATENCIEFYTIQYNTKFKYHFQDKNWISQAREANFGHKLQGCVWNSNVSFFSADFTSIFFTYFLFVETIKRMTSGTLAGGWVPSLLPCVSFPCANLKQEKELVSLLRIFCFASDTEKMQDWNICRKAHKGISKCWNTI